MVMAPEEEQRDGVPTVQFTNVEDLYHALDQLEGDFLIVQSKFKCFLARDPQGLWAHELVDIPPPVFEELCIKEKRRFRIRRYHASTGTLVVTVPTRLHETLHLQLHGYLAHKLTGTKQRKDWKPFGCTTFRPRYYPGGDAGEADSSYGPSPERRLRDSWPTLVIEAGDTEPLSALRDDMRWWFSASEHDVKIVLLTKFDHQNGQVIIERWQEEPQSRDGATETLEPSLQQTIAITRGRTADSYHVAGGGLVLPYRLLFLRDPGHDDRDYIISIEELQDYTSDVWAVV
jgi:hypothetical protein